MQTHSDTQNVYSIGGHSTLSLPAASVQGQCGMPGAPSCCTDGSLMRSIVSESAPGYRVNCALAINDSSAGYGAFLNREDTLDEPASCPERLSQSQPDLLSRPIRAPTIDGTFADSTRMRESPFDANDAGRENINFYTSFASTTSPFCQWPSYGTECTIYVSRSPGADVPEQGNMDLHRAAAPVIPNSRVLSTELVREADDDRSSMGFDSCFKLELLPQLSAQERVCERNSNDTWSEPAASAPLEYLEDSSLDFSRLSPLVDRSEELTSVAQVPGAGRNSSRACRLCGTSKTPLWRSGPHGPKSLCNACGIRYKKSRRSQAANECSDQGVSPICKKLPALPLKRKLGLAAEEEGVKNRAKHPLKRSRWPALMVVKRDCRTTAEDMESCLTSPEPHCGSRMSQMATLKRKAAAAKLALLVKQSRLTRVLAKDEEEAAILLMALSCGLVLA